MWKKSIENIELLPNQIHVWRAWLTIAPDWENQYFTTLNVDERARAERFRFPIHRSQFIVGRGILRQLLGKYLRQAPKKIEFEYGDQGKPFLKNSKDDSLQFNLSHSGDQAVFAFAKNIIFGVDVEIINPEIELAVIAPRFFSKNENKKLFALPGEKQVEAFFNCWTRKEAFIKALGGGLSIPLDKFEMSLLPNEKPQLLAIDPTLGNVNKWSVFSFLPEENSIAALAVNQSEVQVCFFDY